MLGKLGEIITSWLHPPNFSDSYEQFAGRILHYSLLMLFAAVIVFEIVISARGAFPYLITLFGASFLLLRLRQVKLSINILMFSLWFTFTLVGVYLNGVFNSIMLSYLILIMLAALLFKPRWVLLWSAFSAFTVVIIGLGQAAQVLPTLNEPPTIEARVFYLVVVFMTMGIFLTFASQVVLRSIQTAQASEATLRERNQQLEQEIHERQQAEARERELLITQARGNLQADFFNTLSHDLKTPLATINTSLYLLKHAKTEEQREKRIQQISSQVSLVDRYVQEMLMLTRIESSSPPSMTKLSLSSLVHEVLEALQPQIEEKKLAVSFTVDGSAKLIIGNRDQLHRLLLNLIENAIKYTPPQREIKVDLCAVEDAMQLTIRDHGIGIEPKEVPHIFEPFYRTAEARATEKRGTGLGLAIVKKIADSHGIQIDVQSRANEGTTFTLLLPVAPTNPQKID